MGLGEVLFDVEIELLISIVESSPDLVSEVEGARSTEGSVECLDSRLPAAIQLEIAIQAMVAAIAPKPAPELKTAHIG